MLSKGSSLNLPGRSASIAAIQGFQTVEQLYDNLPFGPQSRSYAFASDLLNNTAAARSAAKGLGIAGNVLSLGIGAWDGYQAAQDRTTFGGLAAGALVGAAQELDNLAVVGGTSVAAGFLSSPLAVVSFGTAPAILGTTAGVYVDSEYKDSVVDKTLNEAIGYSETYIADHIDNILFAYGVAYAVASMIASYASNPKDR